MTDDREVSSDVAALLGALADDKGPSRAGDEAIGDDELLRLEAEMGSLELRQELASHRALVSELRAMPTRAPSPDWGALEAKIRQACDEVPARRRWSLAALRELWRWPAFGVGAAAMASLALLLWQRTPRTAEPIAAPTPRLVAEVPGPVEVRPPVEGPSGLRLEDETLAADEIDADGVDELMRQLPAEAAIALGAGGGDEGALFGDGADVADVDDLDEAYAPLLSGESYDDELEALDAEALRALDQWLEEEQKG